MVRITDQTLPGHEDPAIRLTTRDGHPWVHVEVSSVQRIDLDYVDLFDYTDIEVVPQPDPCAGRPLCS